MYTHIQPSDCYFKSKLLCTLAKEYLCGNLSSFVGLRDYGQKYAVHFTVND